MILNLNQNQKNEINDVYIVDYSDKAVAVFGKTFPIKDELKLIGGKFNKFLVNPKTGKKEPGWIFSKKKKNQIIDVIK